MKKLKNTRENFGLSVQCSLVQMLSTEISLSYYFYFFIHYYYYFYFIYEFNKFRDLIHHVLN